MTIATMTKMPTRSLRASVATSIPPVLRLLARLAVEERVHARVGVIFLELERRALGDDRFGRGVEHDAARGDGEDARQLVRDDDDGGAEAAVHLDDELVELDRGDRVEPGRGLVEE